MPHATRIVHPPWYIREFTGRRLLWNIFFYGSHGGLFAYGWWKQQSDPKLAGLNTLKFSVWFSRGAGLCLGYDGFLLLLPVLRNLIMLVRPKLTWLMPLDENIWFHRQIAYATLFFTIVHTTAHYVNFINVELTQIRKNTAWGIHYTQPGGFTGHIMLMIMVLMYTTAHHKIRHQCFELFWYTHHLAFFWLLGLYTHASGCFVRGGLPGQPAQCLGYFTNRFTIVSGVLYFLERVLREVRARRETRIVGVYMHPSGAMEIRFKKPSMKYKSGQWLFLQVPEVSQFQWHPFTISSAPSDPYISVHVRQAGDFTKQLGERLGCSATLANTLTDQAKKGVEKDRYGESSFVDVTGASSNLPSIRVDGPFGAPAEDVFKHEVAVLIGTGIGVTPFASVLRHIGYMAQQNKLGSLRKVEFIWINRDTGAFEWFAALLKELEQSVFTGDLLRINTYITSKMEEDQMYNIALNDVGAAYDPLTNLKARTHFGRPDFPAIFSSIRSGIESGSYLAGIESSLKPTVNVFYCGPGALAKDLKVMVAAAKSKQVDFGFFKEHF